MKKFTPLESFICPKCNRHVLKGGCIVESNFTITENRGDEILGECICGEVLSFAVEKMLIGKYEEEK